jgi:hypothetical protein
MACNAVLPQQPATLTNEPFESVVFLQQVLEQDAVLLAGATVLLLLHSETTSVVGSH